ncbi:MAG: prepilin-type N-terminal cleavage/methylation domain-containing protein [Candidatus Niyogibacteria bacterium]|nr:prepilin-type N-terminal cleavage/methylation domain-containing protein [Candidatus Niyogibacteria bacterium]
MNYVKQKQENTKHPLPLYASCKSGAGFTLIETMVAIAIGTFIAFMLVGTTTAGLKQMRYSHNSQRLHANAVFIIDAFTYWTKQARILDSPDVQTLTIELSDGATKTLTSDINAITLNGSAITTDDIAINSLTFTKLERSVQIDFELHRNGYDETFHVTTTVALRNDL